MDNKLLTKEGSVATGTVINSICPLNSEYVAAAAGSAIEFYNAFLYK